MRLSQLLALASVLVVGNHFFTSCRFVHTLWQRRSSNHNLEPGYLYRSQWCRHHHLLLLHISAADIDTISVFDATH